MRSSSAGSPFPDGFITIAVVQGGRAIWEGSQAARDREPIAPVRLTARQRRILMFLGRYRRERGQMPSQREIASATGLSGAAAVGYQLRALQAKGLVELHPGRRRAVVLNATL